MTFLSREGLVTISQEIEIVRARLNKIEDVILQEQLNKRKEDHKDEI